MTARSFRSSRAAPIGVGLRGLDKAIRCGERTFLRLPLPSDRAEFCAMRTRSLRRLRPWEPKPPRGKGSADDFFTRLLSFRRSTISRKLLLCLAENGAIAGVCSLNEIVRGALQGCFAGWWIGDPYEGYGYMREGLSLLLEHAFLDLRLHRVEANIRPENVRSKRTAEAVGFAREGYSPKYLQIDGEWCDHERWAVRSDAWLAIRKASRPRAGATPRKR